MKKSQLPSDCGNYIDEKEDSLSSVIRNEKEGKDFMNALNNLKEKRVTIGYCSYSNSTIFLDQNRTFITDIHENDGDWRTEYFSIILEHFGIKCNETETFDELLAIYETDIENGNLMLSDIDYTKFKIKMA